MAGRPGRLAHTHAGDGIGVFVPAAGIWDWSRPDQWAGAYFPTWRFSWAHDDTTWTWSTRGNLYVPLPLTLLGRLGNLGNIPRHDFGGLHTTHLSFSSIFPLFIIFYI